MDKEKGKQRRVLNLFGIWAEQQAYVLKIPKQEIYAIVQERLNRVLKR